MKTSICAFLLCLAATVISCSKSDNGPADITGHWKMTASFNDSEKPGQFIWQNTPDSSAWTLKLNGANGYQLTLANSTYQAGYQYNQGSRLLTLLHPDGQAARVFRISEFGGNTMVLDYRTDAGLYRQRYERRND
jgi:hypothetical protein